MTKLQLERGRAMLALLRLLMAFAIALAVPAGI
jgi:hypothetical protein